MSILSPFWVVWRLFRASSNLQMTITAAGAGLCSHFERGYADDGSCSVRNSAKLKA
jgi:hypothetical protein